MSPAPAIDDESPNPHPETNPMAANSNIEWTDRTWNPVSGCTFASEGCRNCYAVAMTHRLEAMGQVEKYGGLTVLNARGERHFNGTVKTHNATLTDPLGWKKPQKVFVNSMSDLFHKDVPFDFIDKVFAVMALCPQHTFQVLTKRPDRMAEYLEHGGARRNIPVYDAAAKLVSAVWDRFPPGMADTRSSGGDWWPLPNVWLGTSVENQDAADKRIPHLLKCPAAVRFLSYEPALGPLDLTECLHASRCPSCGYMPSDEIEFEFVGILRQEVRCPKCSAESEWPLGLAGPHIHWVIAGGESGPKARPMHPDWVRSIRDQCAAAGVPFHFKQWGEWAPISQVSILPNHPPMLSMCDCSKVAGFDQESMRGVCARCNRWEGFAKTGKRDAGRVLDDVTHDAFPEQPG